MDKKVSYKYAPYMRDENEVEVAYKLGVSVATLLKLKGGSRPSYSTLKKFYDAGYPVMQSFEVEQ